MYIRPLLFFLLLLDRLGPEPGALRSEYEILDMYRAADARGATLSGWWLSSNAASASASVAAFSSGGSRWVCACAWAA